MMKHPAWIQELLDEGWVIEEDCLVYPKEIIRDTMVVRFYNHDSDEFYNKIYKLIDSIRSIRNLRVPTHFRNGYSDAFFNRCKCGFAVDEGERLCWGDLKRSRHNVKKIPEMLRVIPISWELGRGIANGTIQGFVRHMEALYGSKLVESGDLF